MSKARKKYQIEIDLEKMRLRQQLAIIAICRSGIITCYEANKNIPKQYKQELCQLDEFLFNAQEAWGLDKLEEGLVVGLLNVFKSYLKYSRLNGTEDMITTIALSQTAIDSLRSVCDKDKLPYIDPIVDLLAKVGHRLHDGMKDSYLIKKFEVADEIVEQLYKIIGFSE